jgi:NADPH2:quinone reductase
MQKDCIMKAIVVEHAGPPEVLKMKEVPTPQPRPGWVLIRVKAFGLNRSELMTRQGYSPDVVFPRVLGIECVGVVEAAPETDLHPGQTVAAVQGGLGRAYDGGYAQYTLVPARQVIPLETHLPWETLSAIPETFLTAWGSLIDAMEIQTGQTILIRGTTSSVGMAALSLAKEKGVRVIATTRTQEKVDLLRHHGADHVLLDRGQIAQEVRQIVPSGVHGVLELVGVVTLRDSLQATALRGIVCNTGMLGNAWMVERFEPLVEIPSTVRLTVYSTSKLVNAANSTTALQHIVDAVQEGRYSVNIARAFRFDEIVEAHRYMEESRALGKLVVVVDA